MIILKKKYIIKRHNIFLFCINLFWVIFMKVKIFDESHEEDLSDDINNFISNVNPNIIDIKYCVSISVYAEEQIFCFSALIIYEESK